MRTHACLYRHCLPTVPPISLWGRKLYSPVAWFDANTWASDTTNLKQVSYQFYRGSAVTSSLIKKFCRLSIPKGTVSRYKGRVLLFLKHFKSTAKRDEYGRHARASPDDLVTTYHRPIEIDRASPLYLLMAGKPKKRRLHIKIDVSWPFYTSQYPRDVDFAS